LRENASRIDRQIDELAQQPDVGDIRDPELIDASQRHAARQVQEDLEIVRRIGGGDHETPRLHRQ
jgi:hypothetical protein